MTILNRRLGKARPRVDYRTLRLERYVSPERLPVIPSTIDWTATQSKPWGAMGNDVYGDCVFAAQAHMVQLWTHNRPNGAMVTIPDADILAAHSAVTGFTPNDPSTDNGAVMLDALKHWRSVGIGGHKIAAFVSVNPKHEAMVRAATWLFGGLYAGFALPKSIDGQDVWTAPPSGSETGKYEPGSLGGHALVYARHWSDGGSGITWGYEQPMTRGFVISYCDEMYAAISDDWFANGRSVAGFDLDALLMDLGRVTR